MRKMRNIKTHQQIEPLLAYYRDLEQEERDVVEQHVAHCASCARQLAAYGQMDQALAELMELEQLQIKLETHREQRVAFYAALDKENQAAHEPLLGRLFAFAQQGARILLLLLLVVGVVWILRGQALKNFSPQTADQSLPEATETSLLVTPIPTPQQVMTATFGLPPLLQLKGYDVQSENLAGGEQKIRLTYHWQVIRSPTSDVALFTQLLNAEGQVFAQNDQPLNMQPSTTWQPGEVIMTPVELFLKAWQEGSDTLMIGIYDSTTGERLPIQQDGKTQANGQVILEVPSHRVNTISPQPTENATSTPTKQP